MGMLSAFEFPCPRDGGTGILKAAQGLTVSSVELKLIGVKEVFRFGGGCGSTMLMFSYKYAVDMSLTNENTEPVRGTALVTFNREFSNQATFVVDEEGGIVGEHTPQLYVYVAVPAETTINIERVLSFEDLPSPSQNVSSQTAPPHTATVEAGRDVQDPTCGGTGKLPFVQWIQAKLKEPSFE